jgi:hypothetical protein
MKYVAPEMEMMVVLAADVITTSPVAPKPGELPADMLKEKAITFVKDNAKVTTARKPRAKKEEADKADAE